MSPSVRCCVEERPSFLWNAHSPVGVVMGCRQALPRGSLLSLTWQPGVQLPPKVAIRGLLEGMGVAQDSQAVEREGACGQGVTGRSLRVFPRQEVEGVLTGRNIEGKGGVGSGWARWREGRWVSMAWVCCAVQPPVLETHCSLIPGFGV